MLCSPARLIRYAATVALLVLPTTTAQAQDITTGLVGHWTLDETSGTTATDSSSSGYNGTMQNGITAAGNTAAGQIGTSLVFDGVDDYINMGDINALDGMSAVTLSGWIRTTAATEQEIIEKSFCNGLTGTFELFTGWPTAGVAGMTIYHGGSFSQALGPRVDDGNWHLITGTFDGSTISIYVDGVLQNSTAAAVTMDSSSAPVNIGGYCGSNYTTMFFDGNIDDARIYNRALSAADVAALYAYTGVSYTCLNPNGVAGQITFNTSDRVLQYCNDTQWIGIGPASNITGELVGHWALDETSGTTATDSSVSGNNGSMTNMSGTANNITGTVGTALSFNSSRITAGTAATNFDNIFAGGGTISYWVYPTSWGTFGRVIDKSDSGTFPPNSGWHTQGNTGVIKFSQAFSSTEGDWESAAASVLMNTWSHIAITYNSDSTANAPHIFVNSSEVAVATITAPVGTAVSDAANPITLGARQGGGNNYTGYMDDVRMYSRAMSAYEIQNLYNLHPSCTTSTSGLVGHWRMNETTGAAIADISGNGNNGVWTDGGNNDVTEETVAGQDGTGLSFDETDDVITVPHSASLDIATGYTLSGWVWFDSTAATVPITPSLISKNNTGGWGHGWIIGRTSGGGNIVGGNVRLSVQHSRNIFSPNASYSGWIYPVDTWNYVTVSWDGDTVRYYLNGALVETDPTPVTAAPDTGSGDLEIGFATANWWNTYHAGDIDDLRLYNRALSDTEISSLYGSVGGGVCSVSTCTSPFGSMGAIIYNSTHNVMQYCNGSEWIAMGPPGDGGGGCSNPSGVAGSLVYNSTLNVLQYCEGDQWIAMGGSDSSSLSAGLLAHWRLDETSGSAITDSSGSGNNATWTDGGDNVISGADSQATARDGTGLNFSGHISNFIQHNSRLGNPTNLTLAGWVNINSVDTSGSTLVSIGGNAVLEFFTNRVEGTYQAAGSVWRRTTYNTDILGDGWVHVAWTFDDTNNAQVLYINGSPVANSSYTESINWASSASTNTFIAKHAALNTYHLIGSIDDVRVYNRSLSATDISNLYDTYTPPSFNAALLHHWTMDEDPGVTPPQDSVGSNDCTVDEGPATSLAGQDGTAMFFAGDSYDCGDINASLSGRTSLTYSGWFKRTASNDRIHAGTAYDGDAQVTVGLWDDGTAFCTLAGAGGSYEEAGYSLPGTDWHHITCVYDGTQAVNANRMLMYVDGALVSPSHNGGNYPTSIPAQTNPWQLGRYAGGDAEGAIDDVRIYGGVLSATEVQTLYTDTHSSLLDGLIAHFPLDETSGSTIADSSGHANNGTWSDSSGNSVAEETIAGQSGTALSFDGSDDYINAGNPALYQLTGSMSVAAWVQGDDYPEIKHIVSKQGNTPNYGWRLATSGATNPFVFGVTSTGAAMTDRESAITPTAGTWYHVVGVYDATAQTLDIYVNGTLNNGTLTGTVPSSQHNSTVNVNIGRRSALNRYFDGTIDDVLIYNRALTAGEVSTLYNSY